MLSGNTFSQKILFLHDDEKRNKQTRYQSWNQCHYAFEKARKAKIVDRDILALRLGFYLFSWGMFRNSFLRGNNYSIHKKVVAYIFDPRYKTLWNYDPSKKTVKDLKKDSKLIFQFCCKVKGYYSRRGAILRKNEPDASDTLLSKICLGTFACLPAFDANLQAALSTSKQINTKKLSRVGILALMRYVHDHHSDFSTTPRVNWPLMKRVDAALWQYGGELLTLKSLTPQTKRNVSAISITAGKAYLSKVFGPLPKAEEPYRYYHEKASVSW